jgi:hypothetical protein
LFLLFIVWFFLPGLASAQPADTPRLVAVPALDQAATAEDFEFVLSIRPIEAQSNADQAVAILKLAVSGTSQGGETVAEAIVWWVTPAGHRVSIPLRPVDESVWATRALTPRDPGVHRLVMLILTQRADHTLRRVHELRYRLDLPELMLTRESARQLGEGHESLDAAPPAVRSERAGWSPGVWVLIGCVFLLAGAFAVAGYVAIRPRWPAWRRGLARASVSSDRSDKSDLSGSAEPPKTAAAPATTLIEAPAAPAAAASAPQAPERLAAEADKQPDTRKPAKDEPRAVPDKVREAHQVLAGLIDKSAPGLGASALAASRTELENAETEARSDPPVPPEIPVPDPEAVSSEELIKSLQMTMDQAELEPTRIEATDAPPDSREVPDAGKADASADLNDLQF